MTKKGTRRACIFCGRTDQKISGEHLWPEWVQKLVPEDHMAADYTYIFESSEKGEIRRVEFKLFDLEINDVCKPCNEGWMSRLETAVQPIIKGMLLGRGRQLHDGGQTIIAAWGVMKSLVAHQTFERDKTVPREHYDLTYALRDAQRPPDGPRVYTAKVGWSDGRAEPGFYRLNGLTRGLPPGVKPTKETPIHGYLTTFSILNVMVQVFWPYDDWESAEFRHGKGLARAVHQIWPPTGTFIWPPGPTLAKSGLRAISGPLDYPPP